MSTFIPGNGGTLRSNKKPPALFELAQTLVFAELAATADGQRHQKVSLSISVDEGLILINAELPIVTMLVADGEIQVAVVDSLGTPYSDFSGGAGTLASTHLFAALVELALLMVASDQAQPVSDRSSRVQVLASFEAGLIAVDAALPFTVAMTGQGDLVITAVDYLYEPPPPPPPPPPMPSVTPYTASQSSVFSGRVATYSGLTDGLYDYSFLTNDYGLEWIKATFPLPVTVASVIVGGGFDPNVGNTNIGGTRLEYSSNDVDWTTLTTIQGDYNTNPVFSYALPQPITARYWRVSKFDYLAITELSFAP